MKEIMEVFNMKEVNPKIRASIIIKLGKLINDQMSLNITEPLVVELVNQLDPNNAILKDEHYKKFIIK